MDKLTQEEFHTLAREREITLSGERKEAELAADLFKNHGWLGITIHFEKDTDLNTLRLWTE